MEGYVWEVICRGQQDVLRKTKGIWRERSRKRGYSPWGGFFFLFFPEKWWDVGNRSRGRVLIVRPGGAANALSLMCLLCLL